MLDKGLTSLNGSAYFFGVVIIFLWSVLVANSLLEDLPCFPADLLLLKNRPVV